MSARKIKARACARLAHRRSKYWFGFDRAALQRDWTVRVVLSSGERNPLKLGDTDRRSMVVADSLYAAQQQFTVDAICRCFGVPRHLITQGRL